MTLCFGNTFGGLKDIVVNIHGSAHVSYSTSRIRTRDV
jgi:hypothetical protein